MVTDLCGIKIEIDPEDEWILDRYRWHKQEPYEGYIYFRADYKNKPLLLHRVIMGCISFDGKIVDHIDGNTLNCKKNNLRIVTRYENMMNRKKHKSNKSGYKGVYLDKSCSSKRYRARIQVKNRLIRLGSFDTPEKAYKAYCDASKKYHGEYGRTA